MASYKRETQLNEKDSLQDMLNLEKTMVKVYGTVLTESVSKGFRNQVEQNFKDTAKDQLDVFLAMTNKGFYKVQSAQETQLSTVRNKYNKVKAELC